MRAQFEVIHARSAARGEMVQAITGIPWYYRMFGYEMTVDLDVHRQYRLSRTPEKKKAEEELFQIRPASTADIPFIQPLYEAQQSQSMISRVRDETLWRYEMETAHRESVYSRQMYVIETVPAQDSEKSTTAKPVAYVEYKRFFQTFSVREMRVIPGCSWRAVGLFLLRYFQREGDRLSETLPKPVESVTFHLGDGHPLFEALPRELKQNRSGYAWYIRVPDLPGFIQHIKPVLEMRLAHSVMAGHTGTIRLNIYTSNMTLVFEEGKLKAVGTFTPKRLGGGDAAFPDLTFLQLLFGYRSFAELDYAFADCYANDETAVLLPILFPKRYSDVTPLG